MYLLPGNNNGGRCKRVQICLGRICLGTTFCLKEPSHRPNFEGSYTKYFQTDTPNLTSSLAFKQHIFTLDRSPEACTDGKHLPSGSHDDLIFASNFDWLYFQLVFQALKDTRSQALRNDNLKIWNNSDPCGVSSVYLCPWNRTFMNLAGLTESSSILYYTSTKLPVPSYKFN